VDIVSVTIHGEGQDRVIIVKYHRASIIEPTGFFGRSCSVGTCGMEQIVYSGEPEHVQYTCGGVDEEAVQNFHQSMQAALKGDPYAPNAIEHQEQQTGVTQSKQLC